MNIKNISILFLLFLVSVNCDITGDIKCQFSTSQPCDATDSDYATCLNDYNNYQNCLGNKNCSSITQSKSDYISCCQKCNSPNPKIQQYINSYLNCLNQAYLTISTGILAILVALI
ncbi:hypothetical protein ABPG74_018518 [Tetrahymena malaccensis]